MRSSILFILSLFSVLVAQPSFTTNHIENNADRAGAVNAIVNGLVASE